MENNESEKNASINAGLLDEALKALKGKDMDSALDAYRAFAHKHIGTKSGSSK